jgi:3-oxoacyl-[acyl-carrier protein] reductase
VNGRTAESVDRAIAELGGHDRLFAAPGDIATVAGCEATVHAALAELGRLDVLVNNAGVYGRADMAESDEALWDAMIDTNVKGTSAVAPRCPP